MKVITVTRLLADLLVFTTAGVFGQNEDWSFPSIKEKVTARRPYTVGDEIEVRVPRGQTIQFDCAENAYWLKECLVYHSANDLVWVVPIDVDGCLMRGVNGYALEKKKGSLLLPVGPCLTLLRWTVQDQTLSLRFCVSTNVEQNAREYEGFSPVKLPETERLAGFVRLWSEVKYNFVSFDRVPEVDWDKVLVEYLPKVQNAETKSDYFCVLAQCLALLHDGHTDISGRPHPGNGNAELPLNVELLAGGRAIIVQTVPISAIFGSARRAEFLKADLKPGEEITHVDGRPVKDILERDIYPYICASTAQDRDRRAAAWLFFGEYASKVALRIKGLDGNEREVSLTRKYFAYDGNYMPRRVENKFECRVLQSGVVYINLPSFGSKEVVKQFRGALPQILKSKGLILDVRRNGGGNSANGDAIISLLTDKPIPGTNWKTRNYLPAFRAWGRKAQWHEEPGDIIQPSKGNHFLGPMAVLTGPATFSAAEDFVVPLHASKRARIVGERTAGSTGQPLSIELPFGGHARVCTKRDTYPDGREFVGVGVIPDIEVHPTPTDIAAGRDVILERAIEALGEKTD